MPDFIPPDRDFANLTWPEVAALDRDRAVLVQPMGAIEQHGPHLPLCVDSALTLAVLGRSLARLDPALPVYALPPLHYGKSNEHADFPGTIALSATTLLAVLMETGESLYRAGFRKLVFLNGHGGQPQVVEIAATDLRSRYPDFQTFPLFLWRVSSDYKAWLSERERALAMHAGDAETSLMLAIAPELVRMERAVAEYPRRSTASAPGRLGAKGPLTYAWVTRDLSHSGVVGDGKAATKEKGDRILESLADGWAELLAEIAAFAEIPPTGPEATPNS